MDPCPFVRIVIGNLALKYPGKSNIPSLSFYCKFKLKGFPSQVSDIPFLAAETDAVESKVQACFVLRKTELEKLTEKSCKLSCLKIGVYRRNGGNNGCGFFKNGKLLGCVAAQLDLKCILENSGSNRRCAVQNGWVLIGGSDVKLHLNVRLSPTRDLFFGSMGGPSAARRFSRLMGM